MGVSGLTQNKLFKVKSLDPNEPYKVGLNGVTDVYNDENQNTIVEYEIDDISYKTYLPPYEQLTNIDDFNKLSYKTSLGKKEIIPVNSVPDNNSYIGDFETKLVTGSKFYTKNILKTNNEVVLNKYTKPIYKIPVQYKESEYEDSTMGDTIFQTKEFSYKHFVTQGIYKNETYMGFINKPEVSSDLFIERDRYAIYERQQRLSEIDNLAELFTYRNGYYTEINVI